MPTSESGIAVDGDDDDEDVLFQDEDPSFPPMHESVRSSIRQALGSPQIRRSTGMSESSSAGHRRRRSSSSLKLQPIAKSLRWMTNISALMGAFLFTGIIFGWAPLKVILIREGQYHEYCTAAAAAATTNDTTAQDDDGIVCMDQMDHYNVIFTMAQFVLSFSSLLVGMFLDHASKTTHYVVAAIFQIVGLFLFGFSDSSSSNNKNNRDYFVVSYSLLALSGCMTMLGGFPASFLVPKYQPAILAAMSCLFDASSIVFAVFSWLNLQNSFLFSRQNMFRAYAVIAILVYAVTAGCWHRLEQLHWKAVVDAESNTTTTSSRSQNLLKEEEEIDNASTAAQDGETSTNAKNKNKHHPQAEDPHLKHVRRIGMHERPILQQLRTYEFALILIFASIHMLRCNFYIGTVNEMLFSIGDTTFYYSNLFGFVLPAGIVFVPFIDATVRKLGIINTLHFTNLLGIFFGLLLLVPNLQVQVFTFFVFTSFRAYLYATLNTFIALTFGVATMGRAIGSVFTTASIATLFMYPVAALAEQVNHGDFTNANTIMLLLNAIPTLLAWHYSQAESREEEASSTTIMDVGGEGQPLLRATTAVDQSS